MNIFNHEDQLALKAKIENFLGKEVPSFLGSPHMHIFKDIFDKLEQIGTHQQEQNTLVSTIEDAKSVVSDVEKPDLNQAAVDIVKTMEEANTLVQEVKEDGNGLQNAETDFRGSADETVHAADSAASAEPAATTSPTTEQPSDATTDAQPTEPANG